MRSTGRLLLSRIGRQRQPCTLGALHSATYARFYTNHIPSEEKRGVWNVARNCLSWIKNKLQVRVIVPDGEAYVVERDEVYVKTLTPGIHSLGSKHCKVARVLSLKEETICVPHCPALTMDGYYISSDGILSVKIVDPKLASRVTRKCSESMPYVIEVVQPIDRVINWAQITTERVIRCTTLCEMFEKRDALNEKILMHLRGMVKTWGFALIRYEIREISFVAKSKERMKNQAISLYKQKAESLAFEADLQTLKNNADVLNTSRMLALKAHREVLNLSPHAKAGNVEQLSRCITTNASVQER